MFGLFRKQNPHKEIALNLYSAAMEQSRAPWFYIKGGVPDSYDGRFDCLLLHIYLMIQKLNGTENGQDIAQELFDVAVADFDQSLREIGVGDTGMKRRMKNMMLAFNGRMHAYDAAKVSDAPDAWAQALERNLYGTLETVSPDVVSLMQDYVTRARQGIEAQALEDLESGHVTFPDLNSGSDIHDTRR